MSEISDIQYQTRKDDPEGINEVDMLLIKNAIDTLIAEVESQEPDVFEELDKYEVESDVIDELKKEIAENPRLSKNDKIEIIEKAIAEAIEKIRKQVHAKEIENISEVKDDQPLVR